MTPQKFLLVLEFADLDTFALLNRLNEYLNIACKGQYELKIAFNDRKTRIAKQYGLLGAPALVNLQNKQTVYGDFSNKDALKDLFLTASREP